MTRRYASDKAETSAIERWETLLVMGTPRGITGSLLTRLGHDGWRTLHVIEHRKTWGNVAEIGQVDCIEVHMQRPSSTAYERSRQQWIEWITECGYEGNDRAIYTPKLWAD